MQELGQALADVKNIYEKVLGSPPPALEPDAFVPFPPGVDPVRQTLAEVEWLRRFSQQWGPTAPAVWAPRTDTWASSDNLLLHVELPGVAREDVHVAVAGNELVVRGERKPFGPAHDLRPIGLERPWGTFERRFQLPPGSRMDSITARSAHGMLEVRVPIEPIRPQSETPVPVA